MKQDNTVFRTILGDITKTGSVTAIVNGDDNVDFSDIRDPAKKRRLDFCAKYIPLLQKIEDDPELKAACREYSVYKKNNKHQELIDHIYESFMKDAYRNDMVVHNYGNLVEAAGMDKKVHAPEEQNLRALTAEQVLGCIAWHFRCDHFDNGSLVNESIAEGHMLRMMKIYVEKEI